MDRKTNETNCRQKFLEHNSVLDSSDSDSDSKSDVSFLAVPEEFRPNAVTRKSPVLEKCGPKPISIENETSNNPSTSKPFSCSIPYAEIPTRSEVMPDSLKKASNFGEVCARNKSEPGEKSLLQNSKKFTQEAEQTRNELFIEDIDQPIIRCRSAMNNLTVSGAAAKPRMPYQDWQQSRVRSRNTSTLSRDVEMTRASEACGETASETCKKSSIENEVEDASLSRSTIGIIELDVANLPTMNKTNRQAKNKIKFEILTDKEQDFSVIKKKNPIEKKYRKKKPHTNQISFSVQRKELIRWDSNLNLDSLNPNLYSSYNIGKKSLESADGTVQWTVVREEKTFVSNRKAKNRQMNSCRQIQSKKTYYNSKNFPKKTEKSPGCEAKTNFATKRMESDKSRDFPKAPACQNALKNDEKKTGSYQTVSYKNNLKEKNILLSIEASNMNYQRKSQNVERSRNQIEYDCCKKLAIYDENESSEDNCCLCKISKSSNEMSINNRELRYDEIISKTLWDKNSHQNLPNSKRNLLASSGKVKLNDNFADDINVCKTADLGEHHDNEYECCGHHVMSDRYVSSSESLHNKSGVKLSNKTKVNYQQLANIRPMNLNVLEENPRQRNSDSDNNNSCFQKERSDGIKRDVTVASDQNENSILQFGNEFSDLVIGCHLGLTSFLAIYKEWSSSRRKLIEQFESLEKNLRESSKRYTTYGDVLRAVSEGASIATHIPHPAVAAVARVISVITSLISKISKSKSDTANVDEPEITMSLFKDLDSSELLSMYGLQCEQQFLETTKFIEEFFLNSKFCEICASDDADMTHFIQGVLEFKPTHRIFYKKLHNCFQELIQNCNSSLCSRFCEPFKFQPEAVDVIKDLDWRFAPDYNNESVRHELEEINRLMQSNDTSFKDLLCRIGNCVRILTSELTHVERCVSKIDKSDDSLGNKAKSK